MNTLLKKSIFGLFALLLAAVAGCDDYSELDEQPVASGDADFSTYVAVGNSLTAGYQSSSLYQSAQQYSFPKLLSRQFNQSESFTQPLISDPGIGGRIELTSLNPLQTEQTQEQGQPINQDQKPFNNLGIPGSILADFTGTDLPGLPYSARQQANPFFGIVLSESANTQAEQLAALNPTFITFWLGNNDVLGFVTSGGEGQPIVPPQQFSQLYQASAQQLGATGASVVTYNIPDVTSIPFVFLLRSQLEQQGVITFNQETQSYQLVTQQGNLDIYIDVDGTPQVMRQDDFPLLSAQSYFNQIAAGEAQPPVTPQTAIPDQLVLDGNLTTPQVDSELEQAIGAVQQYNAAIADISSQAGFAMVDVNGIFNEVIANFQQSGGTGGYQTDDLTLQPTPGSMFSFDGVHISNRGNAVVANETIEVINNSYNADVDQINVSNIPQGLPVAN